MDLRRIVLSKMAKQRPKMSRYRLVQLTQRKIPCSTLYGFLAGDLTLNSDYLGIVFDVLNIKVK